MPAMKDASAGRGRPRDPELAGRVLAAALAEYGRTGWSGFTLDAVARRAGVGKAALYLRWPTKERLLVDALEAYTEPLVAHDTGSLRGDVTALASALFVHYLDPTGWVTVRVAVDALVDPGTFAAFHERIVAMHWSGAEAMVERAVLRGELPDDVSARAFIEGLFGTILMHVMSLRPGDRDEARRDAAGHVLPLVDFVLAGVGVRTPDRG